MKEISLITAFAITHQGIFKLTVDVNLLALSAYVAYRRPFRDDKAAKDVEKELKKNKIDYSQLVDLPMTNCNWADSSTEDGNSAYRHWRRKWNASFCEFKNSGQLNIFLVCNLLYRNCKLRVIALNNKQLFLFPYLQHWNKDQKYMDIFFWSQRSSLPMLISLWAVGTLFGPHNCARELPLVQSNPSGCHSMHSIVPKYNGSVLLSISLTEIHYN